MTERFTYSSDASLAGPEPTPVTATDRHTIPSEISSVLKATWESSDLAVDVNAQLFDILSAGYMLYIRRVLIDMRDSWTAMYESDEKMLKFKKVATIEEMEQEIAREMCANLVVEYIQNSEDVTIPSPDYIKRQLNSKFYRQRTTISEQEDDVFGVEVDPAVRDFMKTALKNIAITIVKDHCRQKQVPFAAHIENYYGYKNEDECFDRMAEDTLRFLLMEDEEIFEGDAFLFKMRNVRHACLNVMGAMHYAQLRRTELEPAKSKTSVHINKDDALSYLQNIHVREHEFATLPIQQRTTTQKLHRALSPKEIEFNEGVTVRLAGTDKDGNLVSSLDRDIELFQKTERILTQWLAPFHKYYNVKELSPEQQAEIDASIAEFHEKGGHAGMLPPEKIRYLMQHGIVLFIEKEVRDGVSIVLGTVSALTRTPCKPEGEEVADPKRWEQTAHELFPQYDMGTLSLAHLDNVDRKLIRDSASERILIARSSILHTLSTADLHDQLQGELLPPELEGMSIRRLGLAGRAKIEILDMAVPMGRTGVALNIGTINKHGKTDISMGNRSSTEHNAWVPPFTWRTMATPLTEEGYRMLWVAHLADKLGDGQAALSKSLIAKKWDFVDVQDSTLRNLTALIAQVREGRHAEL